MKILIDTNVILDFFLAREPQRETVTELFEQIYQERVEAFTTASSITDIYYITAKRLGDNQAREVIYNLQCCFENFPVENISSDSYCQG